MAETHIQYTVNAPVQAQLPFCFEPAAAGSMALIDVESSFFGNYTDYQLTSRDNITKSFKGTATVDVKVSVKSGELKLVHYGDVITMVIGDGVTVLSKLLNTADNTVTMLTRTPPTLLDTTGGGNLTAIIVPKGTGAAYKAAWADYAAIIKEEKTMKTVTSGAHYTTVTVDTAEAVKFSFPSTSLSVEAAGGDITVALTDTAQAGDDETITVPDGESRMFIHHRMNIDTYYLTGNGTATLYASNMGDVNPFKAGKRGGDGGGTLGLEEVTLWENDGTTNPDTITLSEAWSGFDEIEFVSFRPDKSTSLGAVYCQQYTSGEIITGKRVFVNYLEQSVYLSYIATNSTTLTLANHSGEYYITKIIGRRYTKVNPSGYRQTVLWENTGTTNPDTITLSEAWSSFDELAVVTATTSQGRTITGDSIRLTSTMIVGGVALLWYNSETTWGSYSVTSSTVLTKLSAGGDYHIAKIIGIKY